MDIYLRHRHIYMLKRLKASVEAYITINDIGLGELADRLDTSIRSVQSLMAADTWDLETTIEIILKLDLCLDISNAVGES